MSSMTNRETQGRTSPIHQACDSVCESAGIHTPDHDCGHDCGACLVDFEQTQQQAEELRFSLLREQAENRQLWLDARAAMRQTLYDLIPQRRVAGVPGEAPGFHQGWDRCREEIERRIQELAKVI